MPNREVNLTKRIPAASGNRYYPAVRSANGRVKAHVVLVDGREELHPEGSYNIEWYAGGKRIRMSVGNDPSEASAMRLRKEHELNNGDGSKPPVSNGSIGKGSLSKAAADYLDDIGLTKKPKTLAAYTTALDYFTESCHKLPVGRSRSAHGAALDGAHRHGEHDALLEAVAQPASA